MDLTPSATRSAVDPPKPAVRFRDRVRERAGSQELLVVTVGAERFGVPLESVDELVEAPGVRRVPGAPKDLLGVFTLGEALLPLYSPASLLGTDTTGDAVALVMRGGAARVALAVDDADDVVTVSLSRVLDAPRTGQQDDLVVGLVWHQGHLLTLLDARAVVAFFPALGAEAA